MRLDEVTKGQHFVIVCVEDEQVRHQAMRLGLYEGAEAFCLAKIAKGPVIVGGKGGDTAVGRRLAEKITVELTQDSGIKRSERK